MNVIIKHIKLIERIDQLVRLKSTGTPEALACRLGISKTKLYRTISTMKALNAPVIYDVALKSFVYEQNVGFRFGFYEQKEFRNKKLTNTA
ncbi:hypothetical protein D1816_19735 [Aquimarina sp. AD10]|uniref:Helix-turn-helix type 11 domain-containing protein n=1 Tax=Aquimarina aggregata TaxID=1642818 RepID=A0A163B233_9FLAO|nr:MULTISPECIES: hypothetical protein [Aquimarina]AXT62497.1 hypothetical protein D1816_19735 [Aquimarina sp. AD10]KZS41001.1 hypothetical protein AWE51_23910 [Aquimarina aggregata]RKM90311.1 hypothetical protein D7033_22675 [Aquimarina sp. AD10]